MPLRTVDQYIESLRDGRDVYYRGARVPDVTTHPVIGVAVRHASIDYAYRRAVEFAERAKKPLYAFPPSAERDALLALPDYVLSRDR